MYCKLYLWLDVLLGQSVSNKVTRVWVFVGHVVARRKELYTMIIVNTFDLRSCGGAVSGP